jgi:hypothetical protein
MSTEDATLHSRGLPEAKHSRQDLNLWCALLSFYFNSSSIKMAPPSKNPFSMSKTGKGTNPPPKRSTLKISASAKYYRFFFKQERTTQHMLSPSPIGNHPLLIFERYPPKKTCEPRMLDVDQSIHKRVKRD